MSFLRRALTIASAAGSVLVFAQVAEARSFRVNDIPNGKVFDCATCHVGNKGGSRNAFGQDAQLALTGSGATSTLHVDWSLICSLDSDGDGFTNGEELGDPNCTWSRGQSQPTADSISNPGDASSTPNTFCGNGVVDGSEECDGAELNGATCDSLGYGTGPLTCRATCKFDASQCSLAQTTSFAAATSTTTTGDQTIGAGGSGGAAGSSNSGGCVISSGTSADSGWPLVAIAVGVVLLRRSRRPA